MARELVVPWSRARMYFMDDFRRILTADYADSADKGIACNNLIRVIRGRSVLFVTSSS
jgi:hypothetical protein